MVMLPTTWEYNIRHGILIRMTMWPVDKPPYHLVTISKHVQSLCDPKQKTRRGRVRARHRWSKSNSL